ncbi:rho GTPase-activating protein 17 isoform X5 [Capricornis sumatraensis]|uniref:rho GTPase-activating protein 17 isoform X5 n=1 Tax=Capricornis sumatraensis TaxID=34865 RepID=UPI0036049980
MCHHSHKRLMACFQGQHGTDAERRHKKLPLTALAQNMQEASTQLEDSLLGKMLETCGDAENQLALELSQHEVFVEKEIVDPLYGIAEVEIPNIQKQRKQLAKLVLDWDSVRARWNQAHKSSGTNFQGLPSKIDTLKEEMDEAGNKVEQCKDQLAADMYNFMAKEGEYGKFFITLLEAQADYHRKALAVLEKALPELRAHQDKWAEKPAFGTPLEEHLKRSGREIALPIEACVMLLLETGMKEEGLFRIGAGASKLKKLKAALDCSTSHLDEFYSDPHAVAGALKSYLRELPEPLMTFNLYEEWTQVASVQDQDKKLQDLWRTCQKLPPQNFVNFRYLIKFLAKLAQTSDINKMTPSNIAIVLGPNLLWAKNEGTLAEMAAATSVHVVAVIEPIIQHANWFFPEEVEFNVSEAFVPLTTPNSNHSSHTGNDPVDSGTLERKRPASMAVMEGDLVKKESRHSRPQMAAPWLQRAQSPLPRALGPRAAQGVGLAPPLRAFWSRGPARATAVLQSPRTLRLPPRPGGTAVRRPPAQARPRQLPAPISSLWAPRTIPPARALTPCAELLKNLLQHPQNQETRLPAIPGARVLQEHLSTHPACRQSRPPAALLPRPSPQARPRASPAPPRSSRHHGGTPAACLRSKPPTTRRRSPRRRPHRHQRSPSPAARARRRPGRPVSLDSSSRPTPLPRLRRPPALRPSENRTPARR